MFFFTQNNDYNADNYGDNYENIISDNNLIYIVPFQMEQSVCLSVYKQIMENCTFVDICLDFFK